MDQQRDFALTQIRKSVEKLGSSAEGYGDPTLMRFLIARSMEVDKAAKMFVQWQKWRVATVPNGFISDSEIPDELEARKIFLQGLSKDKYPVMVVQANKHFPSKDQIQFKNSNRSQSVIENMWCKNSSTLNEAPGISSYLYLTFVVEE